MYITNAFKGSPVNSFKGAIQPKDVGGTVGNNRHARLPKTPLALQLELILFIFQCNVTQESNFYFDRVTSVMGRERERLSFLNRGNQTASWD